MPDRRPSEIPDSAPTIGAGRYYVVNRLGEGGMAGVYRAWDKRLRVWRAVKVLFPQYARREAIRRRFTAEARAMARLEHDNLVRMYDVEETGEAALPGDGDRDGRQSARLGAASWRHEPSMACQVVRQIAAGVGAAHAAGIVHRDVKPQNVLVAPSGVCKLTDFGVALQTGHDLTREGVALGTRGYMAPEQYGDAASVDVRADVYSLGATLWTLLTAEIPHGPVQRGHQVPVAGQSPAAAALGHPGGVRRFSRRSIAEGGVPGSRAAGGAKPAPCRPWRGRAAHGRAGGPRAGGHPPGLPRDPGHPGARRSHGGSHRPQRGSTGAFLERRAPSRPESTSPKVMPYVMPNVQGKATPLRERYRQEDQMPEYVDRAALAYDRLGTPGLTNPRPQEVVAPPPGAISESSAPVMRKPYSTPPPPVRRITPAGAVQPPPPGTPIPLPEPRDPGTPMWALGAIAIVAGGLLVVLVVGAAMLSGRSSMVQATAQVTEARLDLHEALDDVVAVIGMLPSETRPVIDERYLDYDAAGGEPARILAALRLLDELDKQLPIGLKASEPARVSDLAAEARKLRAVRGRYESALQNWQAASQGFPNSVVVRFRWAPLPPELGVGR